MSVSPDQVSALVKESFIADIIVPWTQYGRKELREQTLPRYKESGFKMVSLSLGSDKETTKDILTAIGKVQKEVAESDILHQVLTPADLEYARANDKLAITLNVQGTEYLDGDINLVEPFYRLGVKQTLLVYNFENRVGGGCHEGGDVPLKAYGRELIDEMNRVGMIVDCSHTGYRTTMDAIEHSSKPVMFTHSNPKALWDHDRNILDEQAVACAKRGGLVGVVGVGIFMGDDDASTPQLFRQIDYYANLIGPESITIGSDYVYDFEEMQQYMRSIESPPKGNYENMTKYFQPEQISELVEHMLKAGYSEANIKGILGGNYLRVAAEIAGE